MKKAHHSYLNMLNIHFGTTQNKTIKMVIFITKISKVMKKIRNQALVVKYSD